MFSRLLRSRVQDVLHDEDDIFYELCVHVSHNHLGKDGVIEWANQVVSIYVISFHSTYGRSSIGGLSQTDNC